MADRPETLQPLGQHPGQAVEGPGAAPLLGRRVLAGEVLCGLARLRRESGGTASGAGAGGDGVQAAGVEGLDQIPHRLDVQAEGLGDARAAPALRAQEEHAGVPVGHHAIGALPLTQRLALFVSDGPYAYRHNVHSLGHLVQKSSSVM